ncbi:hypothetical protein F4778DRAFT_795154 [Xylariomycetidae sp. FL2044]|nr:hypothetical protein F4778DRAFT_795154 [Xylariomycetidae sp. FL2044]
MSEPPSPNPNPNPAHFPPSPALALTQKESRLEPLCIWNQCAPRTYTSRIHCFPLDDDDKDKDEADGNGNAADRALEHLERALRLLAETHPFYASRLVARDPSRPGTLQRLTEPGGTIPFEVTRRNDFFGGYTYDRLRKEDFPQAPFTRPDFDTSGAVEPHGSSSGGNGGVPAVRVRVFIIEAGLLLKIDTHHSLFDGRCAHVFPGPSSSSSSAVAAAAEEEGRDDDILCHAVNWKGRAFADATEGYFGNTTILRYTRIPRVRPGSSSSSTTDPLDEVARVVPLVRQSLEDVDESHMDRVLDLFHQATTSGAANDPRRLGVDFDPRRPGFLSFNSHRYVGVGGTSEWRIPGVPTGRPDCVRRAHQRWGSCNVYIMPRRDAAPAGRQELLVSQSREMVERLRADEGFMRWVGKVVD